MAVKCRRRWQAGPSQPLAARSLQLRAPLPCSSTASSVSAALSGRAQDDRLAHPTFGRRMAFSSALALVLRRASAGLTRLAALETSTSTSSSCRTTVVALGVSSARSDSLARFHNNVSGRSASITPATGRVGDDPLWAAVAQELVALGAEQRELETRLQELPPIVRSRAVTALIG